MPRHPSHDAASARKWQDTEDRLSDIDWVLDQGLSLADFISSIGSPVSLERLAYRHGRAELARKIKRLRVDARIVGSDIGYKQAS